MPDGTSYLWIDSDDGVADLVDRLGSCTRLGIDTEFHREHTYWPQCALIQIGWGDGIALIDAPAVDLVPLRSLLEGRTVVMHAASQDLELFHHSLGTAPGDLFDTQVAAGFLGMSSIGLGPLVQKVCGVRLPKADRLTDWLKRPLSDDARTYAASDVAHLFELHDALRADLDQRGRSEWVSAECAMLVERSITRPDPDTLWWRVKEARRLRGRAAAVAQSVAAWRDAHASEVDRPVRSVLPDLALAGIAQRPPTDEAGLSRVRGLRSRGIQKAIRTELLQAIERGQALEEDAVRYPENRPVPPELRAAIPLLMSWVSQRARQLELDPAILATRSDLEDFLRGDADARLGNGWRRDAVATQLGDLLDGRCALSFSRGEGLVLEPRSV